MKRITLILLTPYLLFGGIVLVNPNATPLEDSNHFRTTLLESEQVMIFEGLPHQAWESDLLQIEKQREDTTLIWEYQFYSPSIELDNTDGVKNILGEKESILLFSGPKLCGGFHPDYCISWSTNKKRFYCLICYGCDELVFYDGINDFKYEIKENELEALKIILKKYAHKRPSKKQD